jgi:peptidoglycan/xylan/chitin deacetylase (PgdA/CDA1 family)
VHNIHDRHDRVHTRAHAEQRTRPGAELAPPQVARRPPALPTRVVVATEKQREDAAHYFAHSDPAFRPDRVHVLPLLPEPPRLSPGAHLAPPAPANEAALAEHTTFLWEVLAERSHRSLGRGLLRGFVARAVKFGRRPPAVSLCYHQVLRELRGFDLNLLISEGTLERHMQTLLRRGYRPVTMATQASQLCGDQPADEPTFSVGFDDGYLDTLTIAAPLLASLGVPFTVYVITDVARGALPLPWYELLTHALLDPEARPRALAILESEAALRPLCQAALPPSQRARALLWACKGLRGSVRAALIAALWAEVGARVQALPRTPRYLDTAGVRQLSELGVEISSHTRSHPILTSLDDQTLADELRGSRAALIQLLQPAAPADAAAQCPGLAYPNGSYDDRVSAAAQAAGYRYAVAVTMQPGPPARYHLGRRMLSELSGLGVDGRFSEDILWARIRGTF